MQHQCLTEHDKIPVILFTNAIIQPLAVVVKTIAASIALPAVLCVFLDG
jgi:hypothetical protein